jgi:hypothetical protein
VLPSVPPRLPGVERNALLELLESFASVSNMYLPKKTGASRKPANFA